MDNFDLKKYLAEGKLLKENLNLDIDDDYVELTANSGDYSAFVEDGKVSFSVVYEDEDDRDGMELTYRLIHSQSI
jgi:peroxiredoxin